MAYAEVSDIEARFKGVTFSTTTVVTDAQVDVWLDDYTNMINARIRNRYVVPIVDTNAEAFSVVKRICDYFTSADVDDVLRDSQPLPKDKIPPANRARAWRKMAEDDLLKLEQGVVNLEGVSQTFDKRFYNSNVQNNRSPEFDLSTDDQW